MNQFLQFTIFFLNREEITFNDPQKKPPNTFIPFILNLHRICRCRNWFMQIHFTIRKQQREHNTLQHCLWQTLYSSSTHITFSFYPIQCFWCSSFASHPIGELVWCGSIKYIRSLQKANQKENLFIFILLVEYMHKHFETVSPPILYPFKHFKCSINTVWDGISSVRNWITKKKKNEETDRKCLIAKMKMSGEFLLSCLFLKSIHLLLSNETVKNETKQKLIVIIIHLRMRSLKFTFVYLFFFFYNLFLDKLCCLA